MIAIHLAFYEFEHASWGATKPINKMIDSKPVTRFIQIKMIPPLPLWNASDFVLQFNLVIAHIPGKMNSAADVSSKLGANTKKKFSKSEKLNLLISLRSA